MWERKRGGKKEIITQQRWLFFILYDHLKLVFIFFRFIHSHKSANEEEVIKKKKNDRQLKISMNVYRLQKEFMTLKRWKWDVVSNEFLNGIYYLSKKFSGIKYLSLFCFFLSSGNGLFFTFDVIETNTK